MRIKGYEVGRVCDECGSKMPKFFPRVRVGDQMLCGFCSSKMQAALKEGLKYISHEAPPGQDDLKHCPWCGSGQVVGRSDGNIECGYCGKTFMVKEQPAFSDTPQTIDGEPYNPPEVPLPTLEDIEEETEQEYEDAGIDQDQTQNPVQQELNITSILARAWAKSATRR